MTTLYASSAEATAGYYAQYLSQAPGEVPGVWSGAQAAQLGLAGEVGAEALQALLEGRDPTAGARLGMPLVDRYTKHGSLIRAVAGFDATFSAPKSVSVLWALTGDDRILAVHDQAVAVALAHLEAYGATTRVRIDNGRIYPDTRGLTFATFRQSTSRADDPQLHTHAVISARVQTEDGRWLALDARYLKRHQRMLGGLYQSALRAGLSQELGVAWGPVSTGQAEIAGMPADLMAVLSKRTGQVEAALADKLDEFRTREGRDPTVRERAAMGREAAVDTRSKKTGTAVDDLTARWLAEAAALGWEARSVWSEVRNAAARDHTLPQVTTLAGLIDDLSAKGSAWSRAEIIRAVLDAAPVRPMSATRWASAVERVTDRVIASLVDLDPPATGASRAGDGRSVWIEPTATRFTSERILAEEEHVLTWAMDRQADEPTPSDTLDVEGLDVMQADAARAVAGRDRLVLVEGPAGTGKTTMLAAALADLRGRHRPVFGVAPTSKAAQVLETETGMLTDTLAKLIWEHTRPDRAPESGYQLPAGTTLVVDEAGMIGTGTLHTLTQLADQHQWRIVLVGDPRQLQAVGRGGMFGELCATGRVHELATVHRFRSRWEADASLGLRHGDLTALDSYEDHGRIVPGTIEDQTTRIATSWTHHTAAGRTVAVTASTNEHVDQLNAAIQAARLDRGDLHGPAVAIAGQEHAHSGEIVVTRRNDRTLVTSTGDTVRNRDRWTVIGTHPDGSLTVTPNQGHGTIRLPTQYVRAYVRLGYAATEHGNQGVTTDIAHHLITPATTSRGLYVGATRGRERNDLYVITDAHDTDAARHILEGVLALDRADLPATVHRRHLETLEPAQPATRLPEPVWLAAWREELRQQWEPFARAEQERHHTTRQALLDLQDLNPALDAAKTAWAPHRQQLAAFETTLTRELEPALQTARRDAERAHLGQHRRANRALEIAEHDVHDIRDQIAAVEQASRPARDHYDTLAARAEQLRELIRPDNLLVFLEDTQRRPLERLIDAIDTWNDGNHHQPVNHDDLATALKRIHNARSEHDLRELTRLLAGWLKGRGIDLRPEREIDHGLGIDL